MRVFAQRKVNQQIATIRSPIPGRAQSGQSRRVNSMLYSPRTIGNLAEQRLPQAEPDGLGSHHAAASGTIQSKLAINTSGDIFEQEADRVSEQVMRMPEPQRPRVCACGGACPHCRSEQAGHQPVQTTPVGQNASDRTTTPPVVSEILSSPGQPLDSATRQFMESRFGRNFSQVRVHTGPRADDAARAVEARAFAVNRNIVFGAGQYDPHGTEGRRLLAHELTHVIQQQRAAGDEVAHGTAAPVYQRASALSVQLQKANPAEKTAEDAAFWEWWKLVAGFEGSLEAWKAQPANKSDRGGETNWGVTKKLYMERAAALGLPPTEEGFAAMTPDQAMRFGRMIWKASGASKIKNTGVALVLSDWYWGGIDLSRFSNLLKEMGRPATFNEGKPDAATIDFMNTLAPAELIRLMSKAKAAQYRQIVKKDPTQEKFLTGWLDRNERRRLQAQAFIAGAKFPVTPGMNLWERGQRALREARNLVEMGEAATSDDRSIVSYELWAVVNAIAQKAKAGFAHEEEAVTLKGLSGDLQKEISRLMNVVH